MPSLYEGFSLPAIEAMACGVPLVATTGGALPEVVGPDGEAALTVPTERPVGAGHRDRPDARRPRAAGPHRRGRPRAGCWTASPGAVRRGHDRELVRPARRARSAPDADRRLRPPGPRSPATACSTWAAAAGATRSRRIRRGATVVAFDYSEGELKDVRGVVGAMREAGEIPAGTAVGHGQRRRAAPAVPRRLVRRHRRVRGARAPLGDRVGDDRARARAAAGRSHRGHGAERVPRARLLGARPRTTTTSPAATCASSSASDLEHRLERAGLTLTGRDHQHGLHSPYWWIRCAGGVNNPDRFFARHYHELLVKQITDNPPWLAAIDRVLNPRHRQEPHHLRRAFRRVSRMNGVAGIITGAQLDETVDRDRAACSSPTATSRGPRAVTPTRGTSSRRRWRSTSAAATPKPSGRTSGCAACRTPTRSWHAYYVGNDIKDPTLDTNVACYVATGVWHHYLCTGDTAFLREFWPMVERTIDYALALPDRDRRDRVARRRPGRRRAAHRLVEHPPQPALRDRDRGAARPRAPGLGALARRARHRDRAPARALPRQGPLGDGLVLPDPRRRAARPGRAAAHRALLGHVRRRRPRRALRLGPAVGDRGRDLRARDGARRDRRDRARARALPLGAVPAPRRRRATGAA